MTAPINNPSSEENIVKKFKIYIRYIRHENALIHQRTTWLVQLNGGLLVAIAGLVASYITASERFSENDSGRLIVYFTGFWVAICTMGISSSVLAFRSIQAADKAQKKLKDKWNKNFFLAAEKLNLPELMGGGDPQADVRGARFAMSMPIFFGIFWGVVLVFGAVLVHISITLSK